MSGTASAPGRHNPRLAARAARTVALLAGLALCLAGCSPFAARITHYIPSPAALQDRADCSAGNTSPFPQETPLPEVDAKVGSVPQGFAPVDAVLCTQDGKALQVGNAPARRTVLEQHFSGNYGTLMAALAEQSDRQKGGACPAMWELIPDLWLLNAAGKAVHVQWPMTGCNFSKPGVRNALDALTVSSTKTIEIPAAP